MNMRGASSSSTARKRTSCSTIKALPSPRRRRACSSCKARSHQWRGTSMQTARTKRHGTRTRRGRSQHGRKRYVTGARREAVEKQLVVARAKQAEAAKAVGPSEEQQSRNYGRMLTSRSTGRGGVSVVGARGRGRASHDPQRALSAISQSFRDTHGAVRVAQQDRQQAPHHASADFIEESSSVLVAGCLRRASCQA